jgi:ABC-type antimicrobial peptide transport system permease subunit
MRTSDPIAKTFRSGFNGPQEQVVGLVADGKYVSFTEAPRAGGVLAHTAAIQLDHNAGRAIASGPDIMAEQVRKIINALDPHLPVYGAGSLTHMLGFALFPMHAAAVALSAFGLLALVLAMTGINGLLAYAVSRRVKEIGIRMALGAKVPTLLRFLLGRMLALIACGLGAGFALALLAGPAFRSLVYGASPSAPGLLAAALIGLLVAAIASCLPPVLRAIGTDPITALRQD